MSDNNENGFLSDLMNGAGSGMGKSAVMSIVSMVISAVMGIFMKKTSSNTV